MLIVLSDSPTRALTLAALFTLVHTRALRLVHFCKHLTPLQKILSAYFARIHARRRASGAGTHVAKWRGRKVSIPWHPPKGLDA
jgi:hypothetical protein